MAVLRPELAPHELSTPARRAELVAELDPDELIVIPFTRAFSLVEHERFAEEVLARRLGARLVIVGRNFRYGHGAKGSIETLAESGGRLGFAVEPAPLLEMDGAPVSSSRIRDLLSAGEVEHAGRLLGRPPWLEGTIVRGDGRGRGLGFATANLQPPAAERRCPRPASTPGARSCPTSAARPRSASATTRPSRTSAGAYAIEAHLLDFDRDVYGHPLRLELLRRLRGEERFGSVEELVEQVHRDIAAVRAEPAVWS